MAQHIPPHRKTFKRYHRPGDFHELTFSTYRCLPLLEGERRLRSLSRHIDQAGLETGMRLIAFVFMPNHVHLLILPTSQQPNINLYLARIKQPFSKEVKTELIEQNSEFLPTLTVQERPGKTCFRFWQEGPGYDRNLYSMAAIEQAIEYLHMNPVRKGLCIRTIDWKWSSARFYNQDVETTIDPDLPTIHGLPDDWTGYELPDRTFYLN
jgi:putative transposase